MLAPQLQRWKRYPMAAQEEIPIEEVQPVESKELAQQPFFFRRRPRIALFIAMGLFAVVLIVFGIIYWKVGGMIDARLKGGAFSGSVNIFTSPRTVAVGDALTAEEIVVQLRRGGFTTSRGNPLGWYTVSAGPPATRIDIFPGRDSFPGSEPGQLEFDHAKISRIVSLQDNTSRQQIAVDSPLIATLSESREK